MVKNYLTKGLIVLQFALAIFLVIRTIAINCQLNFLTHADPGSYQFIDDSNAKNYDAEEKWKQIISIASGLFIFISCIGLLGLVILSIQQN